MFLTYKKYVISILFIFSVIGFIYSIFGIRNYNYAIKEIEKPKRTNISLFPQDHLDGVRLEVDGDVNMDYLREILFGIEHHLISPNNKNVAIKTIKKLFYSNDKNHDKYLDHDEVFQLVSVNIKSHVDRAMKANDDAFAQLRDPATDLISWSKFVEKYLRLNNRPNEFIELYLRKFDPTLLSRTEVGILENARRHWANADLNGDDLLNKSEYLGFLHPELNTVSLNRMCDKILMHLDRDMDGQLSEDEFVDKSRSPAVEIITPYPGFVASEEDLNIDSDNEESRRKYFRNLIDTNHDGIANRSELIEYINPRNVANIYRDSAQIITTIDQNGDGKMSLLEMIENYQKVINSKLVNIAAAFHNDDL